MCLQGSLFEFNFPCSTLKEDKLTAFPLMFKKVLEDIWLSEKRVHFVCFKEQELDFLLLKSEIKTIYTPRLIP